MPINRLHLLIPVYQVLRRITFRMDISIYLGRSFQSLLHSSARKCPFVRRIRT